MWQKKKRWTNLNLGYRRSKKRPLEMTMASTKTLKRLYQEKVKSRAQNNLQKSIPGGSVADEKFSGHFDSSI